MTGPTLPETRIIITGAARGIGAATARLLVEGGARVLLTDVLHDEGAALARDLGPNALFCPLDIAEADQWQAAVALAESAFGGINALFNNAGIVEIGPLMDCPPDRFRRVLEVNLLGSFLGIRSVAPCIARAGGGAIINTSSVTGLQGYANLGAYSATKWGLRGLTRTAALELGSLGIRVLSIHPGPIRTAMTSDVSEHLARRQPIPRIGEPVEVARLVRFLLTEASYSTGSEFVIDGGAAAGVAVIRDDE